MDTLMRVPKAVKTFPQLIRWLADTQHAGAVLPISERAGVSAALVHLWVRGLVKSPRLNALERLCAAYGLDFDQVRALLRHTPPPISGGSDAGLATPRGRGARQPDRLSLIGRWLRGLLASELHLCRTGG